MSLPTNDDIKKLDYSFFGVPYVDLIGRTDIDTLKLDYSFFGIPFIANQGGEAPVTVNGGLFFGNNF